MKSCPSSLRKMRGRYNRDRLRDGDGVGVSFMVGFGLSVCKGLCCSALYLSLRESSNQFCKGVDSTLNSYSYTERRLIRQSET